MTWFLLGVLIGTASMLMLYLSARRCNVQLDEEKQLVEQEQKLVVNFMHDLIEASGEDADRTALFQRIVHAAVKGSGATSACVFEWVDGKELKGAAIEGLFPPLKDNRNFSDELQQTRSKWVEVVLKSETYKMGEGLVGEVAKSRQALLIVDAEKEPRLRKHDDPSLRVNSLILSPLQMREHLIGVLVVANPVGGMHFTESDYSLVQSLTEQASMAIHGADLMALQIEKSKLDMDLSLASNIQRLLLPQTFPSVENFDIDTVYRPAQLIGGDLFDVFQIAPHRIGIAIADVSGKGIPAALLMSICQTNLRHFSRQLESPASVLRAMNYELMNDLRQDMFITFIYAVVDLMEGHITMARAGHELPILYRSNEAEGKRIEMVSSEGMALGMVPPEIFDVVVADKQVSFKPGDTFVMYTDGVTEASNDKDEEFSSSSLAAFIEKHAKLDANELNLKIIDEVQQFSGHKQAADDITLMTVKFL